MSHQKLFQLFQAKFHTKQNTHSFVDNMESDSREDLT